MQRYMIAIVFAGCPALAWSQSDLPQKAKAVLETHCYRCHGKNGAVEGGVNYLLDRDRLVERRKIVPGEPAKSRLLRRILSEEMPPEDVKPRLSSEEIAVLKQWIAAGAADFNAPAKKRAFVSPATLTAAIHDDLVKLPTLTQRSTRYFTITPLYNAGLSEDELTTYRQGISKLINSLSWGRSIVPPAAIDPARTIFRIDLRHYKWMPQVWELLETHYPYGVQTSSEVENKCAQAMGSRFVHLRGNWFVAAAALPPLYHDLLQLPTTDRALEKLLLVDVASNLKDGLALRAGFNSSGVSRNNRLIERHGTLYGGYWKSYDFAANTRQQNLFAFPLGPAKLANSFLHDGGEIIFNLPNGLQGYMLVDGLGRRIDKGPTEIVSDPRRPDRAVVNGLSCMSCHAGGIIPKEDQIRPHVERNRKAFPPDELQIILALYGPREALQQAMEKDAERFRQSVTKTGAGAGTMEPIVALAMRFEAELDISLAAAELGLRVEDLHKSFDRSVTLGRVLGPLAVPGGTVQRQVFTEAFGDAIRDLELGRVLPAQRSTRFSWSRFDRRATPTETARPITVTQPNPVAPPVAQPVATQAKPLPRHFVLAPSPENDDRWYYHIDSHPTGRLHCVALSPKNKWLTAFESKTGVASLYDVYQFEMSAHMAGHKGNIVALAFSPDGALLATGSVDRTARIWRTDTGLEQWVLLEHAGFVNDVKFSPDGKWLATASERLRLWDVATGKLKFAGGKTDDWIEKLAFSPNGQVMATAASRVQLWDARTGSELKTLANPDDSKVRMRAVAFSPDGKWLACGGDNGSIRLWDLRPGGEGPGVRGTTILKGHELPVTALAFNPNGILLVSASSARESNRPGEFKAWDVESGRLLASDTGHERAILCVAISPDGKHAVTAGDDGHLRYRDLMCHGKTPLDPFEGHTSVSCLALSNDGRVVVSGGPDRCVRVWDVQTGKQIRELQGAMGYVGVLAVSPEDRFVFGGVGNTVRQWDLRSGAEVKSWDFPGPVVNLLLTADGKSMLTQIAGRFVRVWDIESGALRFETGGIDRAVALSPDGRCVAGASIDKPMRVWDLREKKELAGFGGKGMVFNTAVFSADGKQLLTGDQNHYVCLWDVETGQEIRRFKGHTQAIQRVAFCEQGRKIIAGGGGDRPYFGSPVGRTGWFRDLTGCLIMWDTETGTLLRRWETTPFIPRDFDIAANNRSLIYATDRLLKKLALND